MIESNNMLVILIGIRGQSRSECRNSGRRKDSAICVALIAYLTGVAFSIWLSISAYCNKSVNIGELFSLRILVSITKML